MKTIRKRLSLKFAKTLSVITVLSVILGTGTASGMTVSGAAVPPALASNYGSNPGIEMQIRSFQSGDWKYNEKDSPVSPAWNAFSSKLRHDTIGVGIGDYQRTFDEVLTPAGLNMDVCKRSSVIWMVKDVSKVGQNLINKHTNWQQGVLINKNSTLIAGSLKSAPLDGGTSKSANLVDIANSVSQHETVTSMNMPEMKVICSAAFDNTPPEGLDTTVQECAGKECDDEGAEPPNETLDPKDRYCARTEGVLGLGSKSTEGVWRGAGRDGADLFGNAGEIQLAMALADYDGISAIHSLVQGGLQKVGEAQGQVPFDNSYRWRCTTRFMSYYQSAPANYNTRTSLANIKDDESGKVGNVFDLMKQRSNQNFQTNSDVGEVWYKGMEVVSGLNPLVTGAGYLSEALNIESGLTKTGYADKWNELNKKKTINSRGGFSEFYKVNDSISDAVNRDKKNKNFSSGTNVPATQQALLANGGVLNVEERERQKVVRVVQPYIDFEIRKCTTNGCRPSISNSADYSGERPNTDSTNANEILVDQAKVVVERSKNTLAELASNPLTSVNSAVTVARMVRDDLGSSIGYCAESATARAALMLPNINIGSFSGIEDIISNFAELTNKVNNITIDCAEVVEMANPVSIPDVADIVLDTVAFSAFMLYPNSASFHLSFVPSNADMIVQKAQYDPETVSWWQVLSVNCNLPGFEMALALVPGSDIISDQINIEGEVLSSSIGKNIHAVAKSPTMHVETTDMSTAFMPTNYYYARPGTPSSMLSFYDKECGFNCINESNGFGASKANDAKGNSPSELKYDLNANNVSNRTGAQMADENNSQTYKSSGSVLAATDRINTNFFNIFRDNEEKRIRIDTWYPTNALGTVTSYLDELRNIASNSGDLTSALQALITYATNLSDNLLGNGGSLGLIYDGSEPTSTTITRYQDGTPTIGDFFNIYAVKETGEERGLAYGEQSLDASKGEKGEELFTGESAGIPTQRAMSQDLGEGNSTVEIIEGLVNNFDVKSSWASEKGSPQVFNVKWEYQSASVFPSINSAGFSRKDGTEDKNVTGSHNIGAVMTFLEGKCYAMFGTELGKRTTDMFQANTGTGVPNKLDNNPTGLASQSAIVGESNKENLYINSLRATTE